MEAWMLDDLRRQAEAWLATHRKDAHNRQPVVTPMDVLRHRRRRRRDRMRLRTVVRQGAGYGWTASV
jgi:hypothetical protein